ncbi:hypothetical protein CRYUN_Cryun05aG0026000 [Craigia yunnanensis]
MSNLLVKTTLIHFYGNNKDILSARRVFDEIAERSSVTWNAMIKGYCSQRERAKKCCREALLLFRDMLNDVSGVNPTDTTMSSVHMPVTSEDYVALSNAYASAGRWQQVEMVRKKMKLKRVEIKPGGSSI